LTALDRNWYVWARTPWSCNVRLPWNVYRTEILKFWHQPKLLEDNEILLSRGISFKDLQRGVVFLFVPGPFWFESCTGRFQAVFLLSTLHSPERPCWMLAVPGSSARRALWTYVEGSEHGKTSCTSFMLAPLVLRWLGRCTWQNISGLMIWFQRGGMYTAANFWKCIVHLVQQTSLTNLKREATFWYLDGLDCFLLAEIFYIGRSNGNRQCFSLDAYLRSNRQVQCKADDFNRVWVKSEGKRLEYQTLYTAYKFY